MNKITARRVFCKKGISTYQFDMRDNKNTRSNPSAHGYLCIEQKHDGMWYYTVKLRNFSGSTESSFYNGQPYVSLKIAKKEFKIWIDREYG